MPGRVALGEGRPVVFGAAIADASSAGFGELPVPAATLAELGRSPLRVEGGLLRDACVGLFREWREAGSLAGLLNGAGSALASRLLHLSLAF